MKTKTQRGLTVFSIAFLTTSTVLFLLLGWFNPTFDEAFMLLFAFVWCCAWIPLTFFCCLWLIIVGRHFLKNTYVWLGMQGAFLLVLFGSQSPSSPILLLAVTCFLVMLPLLGIANFIYANQHHLSVRFLAVGSVGFVWSILVAWRIHGNLLDEWLSALGGKNTLLWLNGVMTLTIWMFLSGLISFCVETFRLFLAGNYS